MKIGKPSIIEKRSYVFPIFIIIAIGLIFRVFFTPWDIPFRAPDAFLFLIEAIEYSKGNFENFNIRFLWPLFLSGMYSLVRHENIFDLMTITRIMTIIISTLSIPLVYIISKEFVSKKYSLFGMGIFAISPVLIENASLSIREPFVLLIGLISFYFIIKKDWKFIILGFLFAGLSFDVKINGIIFLFLAIIACFRIRPFSKLFITLSIGIGIFLLIISPYIISSIENDQIPFIMHFSESNRIVSESEIWPSTQVTNIEIDSNYILINSLENELIHMIRISLPFIMIIAPIGLFFVLRNLNQKNLLIVLGILITFLVAYPIYFQSSEYRNIIFAIPFLCILSSIGMEGIMTKIKKKKIILVSLLIIFTISSFVFLNNINPIEKELLLEKDKISKVIVNNFSGRLLGDLNNNIVHNIEDVKKGNRVEGTSHGMFYNDNISIVKSQIPINTEQELIDIISLLKIDYLIIDNFLDNRYPLFEKIFKNENDIIFLEKVFDSNEYDLKEIQVKVFKINFDN